MPILSQFLEGGSQLAQRVRVARLQLQYSLIQLDGLDDRPLLAQNSAYGEQSLCLERLPMLLFSWGGELFRLSYRQATITFMKKTFLVIAVAVLVVLADLRPAWAGEPATPVITPQQIEADWLKQDEVRSPGKAVARSAGLGPSHDPAGRRRGLQRCHRRHVRLPYRQ